MYTRQNYRLDKKLPALIVQHGNAAKRHFYLEQRATTLGNSRGCDIQLAGVDVSGVHCIVTRGANGFYVRDCSSRLGTKVNGVKVEEGPLHNGDILQVGLFSFEVSLPFNSLKTSGVVASTDSIHSYKQRIDVLERARRRLVTLAWKLRRKLRAAPKRSGVYRVKSVAAPRSRYDLNLDESGR
jgi:hypothetical protein